MFGFDPEVPAGYQDADIEMLELAEAADALDIDWDDDEAVQAEYDRQFNN